MVPKKEVHRHHHQMALESWVPLPGWQGFLQEACRGYDLQEMYHLGQDSYLLQGPVHILPVLDKAFLLVLLWVARTSPLPSRRCPVKRHQCAVRPPLPSPPT